MPGTPNWHVQSCVATLTNSDGADRVGRLASVDLAAQCRLPRIVRTNVSGAGVPPNIPRAGTGPIKLVTVVGARPQFVKAFPLSRLLRKSGEFDEAMIHTGQHFDPAMSDIFFAELGIEPPRHFLDIHGGTHGDMTGRMLGAIEKLLISERPRAVIVYGDTNSTLAGALAAAKLNLPIIHIEAGLRSYNRRMPEEVNRIVVDHLSSILLCPTERAATNLALEGIKEEVYVVGDLTFDTAALATPVAVRTSRILEHLGLKSGGYGVVTFHREENVASADRLQRIAAFLERESHERPLILPLHPRTRDALQRAQIVLQAPRVKAIEPLGYLDMLRLIRSAEIVITDSGGLQREAYYHRVPCVTLRDETEWRETIDFGWNRLWDIHDYRPRREIPSFGEEGAAQRIVQVIREHT